MISLNALAQRLADAGLLIEGRFDSNDSLIAHLTNDSRAVGPTSLFAAIRGDRFDGHLFIDKAVQYGAIAILVEAVPETLTQSGTAYLQVTDTRAAWAEAAALFYGDPSHELQTVGITGTNGKSTTAWLVHHLTTTLGQHAGLLGTIAYRIGDRELEATHTTPDALDIQRLFREMVDAGCTACVMEVSSHALAQARVQGTRFDVGVFTNLTQDHLDYHADFAAYHDAKKRLLDHLPTDAMALYNADDDAGTTMVVDTRATVQSYGLKADADLRAEIIANELTGLRLRIDGQERRFRLVGRFNAYNLLAAYGAGRALGYDADTVLDALADAPPVPGRFEQQTFADGTTVIVDYAHTPDALENVLLTIRDTMPPEATLWCVFGCGGDRDRTKRPLMGAIAERYADRVIVTSDNPRTEAPDAILADIRAGLQRPDDSLWIVDRHAAIETAARETSPGDVVLIAGKGHETYQIIGTEKRPFDDRTVARVAFAHR